MSETVIKTGFCVLCRSRCGARYEVADGRLVKALPEPGHPTGKALCTKGLAAPEIVHNGERLLHPLRRTAPKGAADPGWERVSWPEALRDIAGRLSALKSESGAESVAFASTSPSGTGMSDGIDWVERFIRGFGSPNTIYSTEICNWHKDVAHKFTTGSGILYPDYARTETILLWGFNPSAVWLDQATQIAAARARGARIIAVDPRRAGFAGSADSWLQVRPGMDGPLALGLLRAVIGAGGHDAAFLRRWTNAALLVREDTGAFLTMADLGAAGDARLLGWDGAALPYDPATRRFARAPDHAMLEGRVTLRDIACRPAFDHLLQTIAPWTPARVAEVTGVAETDFRAAAEILTNTKSLAYYCWSGVGQHRDATQIDRAIALLAVLKGCHDAPGGNVAYAKVPSNPVNGLDWLTPEMLAPALGRTARPLGPAAQGWVRATDVWQAVLRADPYRIRGLVSFGANMAVSQAGGGQAQAALEALEFHVHIDSIETPTARFADYLLPANTPWEREGLRIGFEISQEAESLVQLRQPMLPAAGESLSDTEILFRLAPLMGMGDLFFGGDIDRAYAHQLAPSGLRLEELRATPEGIRVPQHWQPRKYARTEGEATRGFATETGLVEVYSALLHRHGQPAVPQFDIRPEEPEFPLRLTTAKSPYYCHSQYRSIPSLRRRAPVPQVQIHPDTARGLGLEAGEQVRLRSAEGAVVMQLALDPALAPDVACADFGWWQGNPTLGLPGFDPFSEAGANFNRLISVKEGDPVSGSLPHRSTRCRLEALGTGPAWVGFRSARVTGLTPVTEDCLRVELALEDGQPLPDFVPGQHLVVRAPSGTEDAALIRCYSLVGPAQDAARRQYAITVRLVPPPPDRPDLPEGRMSGRLHRLLRTGDRLEISAPRGRFHLPLSPEAPVILVAGGIGITPFLSWLETLAKAGSTARIHLIEAHRNGQSHPYRARIDRLRQSLPGLTRQILYSAPLPADRTGESFDRAGFLQHDDLLPPDLAGQQPLVFHCGPPPMMAHVETLLAQAGHPAERIFSEAFTAPAQGAVALPEGPFEVHFAQSGKRLRWHRADGTILALAEAAGIALTNGCRAGQCESCALRILKGAVLNAEGERRTESCLTCTSYPLGDLTLDG